MATIFMVPPGKSYWIKSIENCMASRGDIPGMSFIVTAVISHGHAMFSIVLRKNRYIHFKLLTVPLCTIFEYKTYVLTHDTHTVIGGLCVWKFQCLLAYSGILSFRKASNSILSSLTPLHCMLILEDDFSTSWQHPKNYSEVCNNYGHVVHANDVRITLFRTPHCFDAWLGSFPVRLFRQPAWQTRLGGGGGGGGRNGGANAPPNYFLPPHFAPLKKMY